MTTVQFTVTLVTGPYDTPSRLQCDGRSYAITDTPTALDWDWAALTHPPKGLVGWRFQGTDDSGYSRIFDVLFNDARHEWELLRSYI